MMGLRDRLVRTRTLDMRLLGITDLHDSPAELGDELKVELRRA